MKTDENYLEKFKAFAPASKQSSMRQTDEAVILTRVSSRDQMINGASLETQKKYCDEFAQRKGLKITAYFGGTYESAKTDDRKEFQRMLSFVKRNKRISFIIVYNYDRFSRTGGNGIAINENLMKKHGVTTLSVMQPIDPTSTTGSFQQDLFYIFSKYDNDQRREKCMTGMIEKIREGYWVWKPPMGYTNLNPGETADKHRLVINEQGKLLKLAFKWKAKDDIPLTIIARKLRSRGLRITDKRLSTLFQNPFYCGIITSGILPGEVFQGRHEPIVDRKTFLEMNDMLNEGNRGYKIQLYNENLPLKVFVKCDDCGTPMTGYLVRKKGIYYYKCRKKGCGKNRNANALKEHFEKVLRQYQVLPGLKAPMALQMKKLFYSLNEEGIKEQEHLKGKLTEVENKLEGIEEKYVLDQIKQPMYEKWSAKFRQELKEINDQLANCSVSSSNLEECISYTIDLSANLLKMWREGDVLQKQKLQSLVFPDGIRYNRDSDAVLTTRVNSFFYVINTLSEPCNISKEKGKHTNCTSPRWVGPAGLEPATKRL